MSQQLAEAGVTSSRYGSGTANYDRLDRFDRIVNDRWTKDGGSDLYSTDITFDESGNITRQVDNLQRNYGGGSNPGVFDASYTIDSRSRLTRTQEGHWNGSSISTLWRDQQWTLSQTGNWARDKEDWNGDTDFTDTGEVDDTRAHNVANELLTRDTDSNSSVNYTLTHDAVGNMTDDGKDYKFVYDAFGRLRTVKNQSNTVVTEYTYNGLNMRIGWHSDADADADVDGSDPWYSFAHDDRWRIVATFRGSDTSPKELFAYHNAGMNGRGGSSYIDSVILRNKDANTAWTSASDGTLEERVYYAQNWRADVSAILTSAGLVKEWVKYTSYGIPVRIDPGDYNRDGFVNAADFDDYGDDFDNARSEADVNFDGSVNGDDYDLFSEWFDAPSTAGRFTLSASSVANRIGYAGYQYDPTFVGASRAVYHVRHRVYDAGLGRWLRRDPIGYKAGVNLYAYVNDEPILYVDLDGLIACPRANSECGDEDGMPTPLPDSRKGDCCERARRWGDWGPENPVEGFTFCCDGKPTVCTFPDLILPQPKSRKAMSIILQCIRAHEHIHILYLDCNGNCPENVEDPATHIKPGCSNSPGGRSCDECQGYGVEIACLAVGIAACGIDMTCQAEVAAQMFAKMRQSIFFCGRCARGDPSTIVYQ